MGGNSHCCCYFLNECESSFQNIIFYYNIFTDMRDMRCACVVAQRKDRSKSQKLNFMVDTYTSATIQTFKLLVLSDTQYTMKNSKESTISDEEKVYFILYRFTIGYEHYHITYMDVPIHITIIVITTIINKSRKKPLSFIIFIYYIIVVEREKFFFVVFDSPSNNDMFEILK